MSQIYQLDAGVESEEVDLFELFAEVAVGDTLGLQVGGADGAADGGAAVGDGV